MIGNKKYLIKDTVSKKRLAGFVNEKLKSLGYKAKKFKFIKRKPAKVKVDVAAVPKGPRGPRAREARREAPRAAAPRAAAPRGPRAAAPRGPRGGPRGPKPKEEEEEKKGLKTTEQELEELQKRREPESIELYQLSKDSLIDLAKKADIINPSGMTKIQLIQALQKSGITKNDVSQHIVQNEINNSRATEFALLADSELNDMSFKELRAYVKDTIRVKEKDPAIPKIKFNNDRSQLGYIKAIFNWKKEMAAREESQEIRNAIIEEDEKSRVPGEAMSTNYRPARARSAPEGQHTPAATPARLAAEGKDKPDKPEEGVVAVLPGSAQPGANDVGSSAASIVRPITPSRMRSSDIKDKLTVSQLEKIRKKLIDENPQAQNFIEEYSRGKKTSFIESIKNWIRKTFEKPQESEQQTQALAPPASQSQAAELLTSLAPAATPYGVNAEQKNRPANPEQSFVSEGVDIDEPDQVGNQENKTRTYVTASTNTNYKPRKGDPGFIAEATRSGAVPAPDEDKSESVPGQTANGRANANNNRRSEDKKFGIDNHSIDRFLSKYGDEYLGCIAHDEIPSKIYPKIKPRSRGFFVINTDPSWKSGEHWQCVFFDARPHGSGSIEFYDSFADPIDEKLQADLKGIAERLDAKTYLKLKENRIKQQHDDSDNCGYFCMNFITSRMRGKGFPEASGFDESVQGESDINKFKKMHGFGFLPSFGSIASTLQRPLNTIREIAQNTAQALRATAGRVRNVGTTIAEGATKFGNVATNIKETIFFPEKKLPSSIQPIFEKYKNYKIISFQIRREPILAFVDKFINFISFGKFNEAKRNLGYDKMFHLSLILQLENGPKLLIEKNERINMTLNWKDGNQVQYFPASGSLQMPGNPTLGEFYDRTLKAVGDHQFFTYNAFAQNCQAFISDLLRSNNALSNDAQNFVMQDAQTVIKQLPFYVSKVAQFTTDTAGRVRQFFGFGSAEPRLGTHDKKNAKRMQSRALRKQKYENFMRQQSCMNNNSVFATQKVG